MLEEYELVMFQGKSMSGDVFLSELFILALNRISATEQIRVLDLEVSVLGGVVRFSILVMFEFCSHSDFAS